MAYYRKTQFITIILFFGFLIFIMRKTHKPRKYDLPTLLKKAGFRSQCRAFLPEPDFFETRRKESDPLAKYYANLEIPLGSNLETIKTGIDIKNTLITKVIHVKYILSVKWVIRRSHNSF